MTIKKNTAKAKTQAAEEKKPAPKKAPAPKVEKAKEAAPKAETTKKPATKKADAPVEALEKQGKIGRKDIAARIRAKVIAAGAAISPNVAEIVTVAYEEVVQEALSNGEQVGLPGFGTFMSVAKPEAVRPNPQKKGETITIAAHNAPKFKAGSKLKAALNGGNAEAAAGDE